MPHDPLHGTVCTVCCMCKKRLALAYCLTAAVEMEESSSPWCIFVMFSHVDGKSSAPARDHVLGVEALAL